MNDKFKENENLQNNKKTNFKQELLVSIMPAIFVILLDIFFVLYTYNQIVLIPSTSYIMSLIIMYCMFFIIFSITGRSNVSVICIGLMTLLLTFVNWLKIGYTGEPILFTDINFLKTSDELLGMIDSSLIQMIKTTIPLGIILVLIFIVIVCIMQKYNIKLVDKNKRAIIFVIPVLILIALFIPNKTLKDIYLKVFFNVDNRKDYQYYTYTSEYYVNSGGVLAGMYGRLLESRIFEPDNYNEEGLSAMLEEAKEGKLEDNLLIGTPNIIVILSESFWDISNLDEIKFSKDVTPNFSKLKEEGILFDMISPSYGGLTANVEMQLLTGMNLAYYNKGYTPYLQLYNSKSKTTPSIVQELKNNGYMTKIISCTSEDFYNRNDVYSSLGVDESIFLNQVDKKYNKGHYLSDEYLTDRIMYELENKKEDEKLFCMTLTIQQHMPYTLDKYDTYDIQIEESNLNSEMEQTMLAYAQGVFDADRQLGRLNDYIQRLSEPTIVVFFGDHLPYLRTATGQDLMSSLDYFNTEDENLNNYRKYNTQALVLSNYDIKDEGIKYLSPDLLLTYILNRMDINLSEYYKYLNKTYDILPSYNYLIAMDKEGSLYKTKDLKNTMEEIYLIREQLQYMSFIK